MHIIREHREVIRIDAPEWFALEAFRTALDRDTSIDADTRLATFHRPGGPPTDTSDVFVVFDAREEVAPDGTVRWTVESSDLLDEPGLESVYGTVASLTRKLGVRKGVLWLTNVGLDDHG